MGAGWEIYGRPAGYSQKEWDALPQRKKDEIKAFINGLGGGGLMGGAPAVGAVAGTMPPDAFAPQADTPTYDAGSDGGGGGGDGGGGYGGGGGGGAPPRQLATSPEWLAFLNALGLEEGQFRADIERQRGFAKTAAAHQLAQLEPQYQEQRRGITGNSESRGMVRSGDHLRRLAVNRAQQGRDESNINFGLGQQLASLESQLANKMMDLGARRAQQELQLRAGGYV